MTTQVRNIGVEDVKSSPSGIVNLQTCIKELSSEIREMKVKLDSLKRKRVERLFDRQDSKKCWICGSKEHLKKNCSKLKTNRNWQRQQGRMQPRSTRISNNGSGMYIPGKMQGREVNYLIDTGATVTIIKSPIYEQMSDLQKRYLEPSSQQMKMADGKCIQTRGVGNMGITINGTEVKHAVWVAEIDKAIDGILGFDFLQRNHCVIDAETNTFKLNGQPVKCATVGLKSIRSCRVLVDKTSIILPGVERIIPGRMLDLEAAPSCAILVQTEKFTERYQLLMAKSVVNAENNCVPIRVLNPSERSIKVYGKSVAATCEAVTVQNEVPTFPYSPTGMVPPYLADLLERSSKNLDSSQKNEL
ncbi:hypothetical protein ACJMK2_023435, partial [Sinanodonta woodiana]